jgi:hypothetical protein
MTRLVDDIPRYDRRWFRSRPERQHRCRRPDTTEIDVYDPGRGCLIIAIRHMAGRLVYQPVIYDGRLPRDERSAAVLFALAARHTDPIPVIAEADVFRLRHLARPMSESVARLDLDLWFEKTFRS